MGSNDKQQLVKENKVAGVVRRAWRAPLKRQMIAMLSILAAAGIPANGWGVLWRIALSIAVATGLDSLLGRWRHKRWYFSTSAVISALIIALLLPPDAVWYQIITAALLAIGLKHIIRIKGRHLFNPAASGLLVTMFLFPTYLFWWGGGNIWLTLGLGLLIAYRFRRLPLVVSFTVVDLLVTGGIFWYGGAAPLRAITMLNAFFVLVMLVEPKTSPVPPRGLIIYGALAALTAGSAPSLVPQYDPAVCGLLTANLVVPLINKMTAPRRSKKTAGTA